MKQDGFRYLDLLPHQVMQMTHKDFYMLMEQQVEKTYDELERESLRAIMMRAAYHSDKKNMKPTDIFDREKAVQDEEPEDTRERMKRQQEFLNRIQFRKEGSHEQ